MNLEGIKILDMTRLIPGPYATMLLADLGADVVKIEDPETGDYARDMEPSVEGEGTTFLMLNRNKKSLTLNLKREKGKEIFMSLAEEADVIFEQFRPGVVEKLGVDHESVKEVNPEVIYCSLSSYGQEGSSKGGHDLNYASEGGLVDLTRSREGDAAVPGFPVPVMTAGLFSAFSIVSALLERELNDSEGEYIDISILDCLISLSTGIAWEPLLKGEVPTAGETELTGKYPFYGIYETKDGRDFCLAAYEKKYWERFCEIIDREDLKEKQFSQELKDTLRKEFRKKTFDEWKKIGEENEVMISPVKNLKEVFESRHVEDRGLVGSLDFLGNEIKQVGFPAESSQEIDEFRYRPPKKGEHTEEILEKLGYNTGEIKGFEEKNIV